MDNLRLIFRIIHRFYRKHWPKLILSLIMILVSTALTLLVPYLTRNFYDDVISGKSISLLIRVTLAILAASLAAYGLNIYSNYHMRLIDIDVQKDFRVDLTRRINQMDILEYYRKTPAYLFNRMINDSVMMQETAVSTMFDVLRDVLVITIGTIMMLSINVYLTIFVVVIQLLSSIWSVKLGKILAVYQQKLIEEFTLYNSATQEAVSSTLLSKLFSLADTFTRRIASAYKTFITVVKKARIKAVRNSYLIYSVSAVCNFLILFGGGRLVMQKTITIGELIAYIAVFNLVTGPANSVILNLMNFRKNIPVFRRVEEFLNLESDAGAPGPRHDFSRSIDLINCSFSFAENERVVSKLSYSFEPGKIYMIAGASGIGKTTILYLLFGLYPLESGEIRFDDMKMEKENVAAFRRNIGFVEQEPTIVNDTVYGNILIGNPDASQEQVLAAAKAAYVDEFVQKMPAKYETKLGIDGQQLSTGQKQRLAIARALLKNPKLYLFDEPTSNIDSISTGYICDTIRNIGADKFVIVISHGSDFDEMADVTLLMQDGKLVELR